MTHWLIQCSPGVCDVFEWWENDDGELNDWTVSRHLDRIKKDDTLAFWVGGPPAGVYAISKVTGHRGSSARSAGATGRHPHEVTSTWCH